MARLKKYFLFLFVILFSCSVYAQETYRAIPWNEEQGLSMGTVYCMLKDVNGFLWIGTRQGLNRFDGSNFVTYFADKTKKENINSSHILSLVEDSLHHIWIGTLNGLSRYDIRTDSFRNFSSYFDNSGQPSYTMPFWATRDDVYCIESYSRITAYNIHSFKSRVIVNHFEHNWDRNKFRPASSALDTRTNTVWMLGFAGLTEISLNTGKQTEYTFPCVRKIKFPGYVHTSQGMCYDAKRNLIWLNTSDGLVRFNIRDKSFSYIGGFDKIVNNFEAGKGSYYPTEAIKLDLYGRVWLGTNSKGIFIYDPGNNSITQPIISKVTEKTPRSLQPRYFDRDGIIWVNGGEAAYYQLNRVRSAVMLYTKDTAKPSSLSCEHVATFTKGPGGKLWMGTLEGINIFDPATGSFEVLREKDLPGFKGRNIMPLAIDTILGKAWLKAWPPDALFEMDIFTRKCKKVAIHDTTPDQRITLAYMEAEQAISCEKGIIFPLPGEGLFAINGSPVAEQVSNIKGIGIIVNIKDSILFLKRPDEKYDVTLIRKNEKWVQTSSPLDSLQWSAILYNDEDQTLWAGTKKEIIHLDRNFHIIRRYAEGFPGIDVLSMLQDNESNIWFVERRNGISRLDIKTGKFRTLGDKDGFHKQRFAWQQAHVKDSYGDLYFAGSEGFFRVTPEKFADDYPASVVYFGSIGINQQPLSLPTNVNYANTLSLKHDENNISIEAGIIDYYSEGKSRIRYKLEGQNKEWQYTPNHSIINFDNLQPSTYRLVMQASNAFGDFNGPEKILLIQIRTPFWLSWWFRVILIITGIAFIYLGIRWGLRKKFQQHLKQSEKEKQLAELQQQKTELEMQALRAQMNPHFIFNSLNSINRFILQNNKAQASEYLTKFSKLVRMILQNSQASLITLENELESLELYLELESLRFNYHFDYEISVPKDMDISVLKVPPLILQPYVENAIWHGLMHKEEKGHLDIEIIEQNDHLYFKITDDGVGREKAAALASKSATKHKSMGLRITADRIAILNKSQTLTSPVTINDLVDADGSAAGTEVIIKMPVIYD